MNAVFNERTKHAASWLNALATALIAAGAFAPLAALLYGISIPTGGRGYVVALACGCLAVGIGLHFSGRVLLGRLRE